MKNLIKLTQFLIVIFITSSCVTTVRSNSDYESKLLSHKKYSVLPSKAIVRTSDDGRMFEYESHMEYILSEEIKKQLQEKGYNTRLISKKDLKKQRSYREYEQVYDAVIDELTILNIGKAIEKEKAENINNKIRKAPNLKKVTKDKILIFSSYSEYIQSTASRVGSFLLDVASSALLGSSAGNSSTAEAAHFNIGIINTSTNEVLWANSSFKTKDAISSGISNSIYSNEELDKYKAKYLVENALSKLPDKDKLGIKDE